MSKEEEFIKIALILMVLAPGGRGHAIHNFYSSSPIDAMCQVWLKVVGSFRDEAKNVQTFTNIERRATNDDGEKQIAIGHLSDSDNPKREQNRIYILEINSETYVCKISQFADHT